MSSRYPIRASAGRSPQMAAQPLQVGNLVVGTLMVVLLACVVQRMPRATADQRWSQTEVHMGTRFTVVLYAPGEEIANRAFRAAFDRVAELERVFSTYNPESEARRLCATAPVDKWVPISRDLWVVLRYARRISTQTNGAFDVTVGPLTRLWRQARRAKRLPKPEKLAAALEAVGYRYYEVDPNTPRVRLLRPGMRFDFGGIAKGYALDESLTVLKQLGLTRCLVNGGGDIAVRDAPPGADGWKVELSTLAQGANGLKLQLPSCHAVATSGDIFQYLEVDGQRYSHLIDPRTGQAVQGRRQVTVVARSGIAADSWASALSVLAPERGKRLVESQSELRARILFEQDGTVHELRCGGFERLLEARTAAGPPGCTQ